MLSRDPESTDSITSLLVVIDFLLVQSGINSQHNGLFSVSSAAADAGDAAEDPESNAHEERRLLTQDHSWCSNCHSFRGISKEKVNKYNTASVSSLWNIDIPVTAHTWVR